LFISKASVPPFKAAGKDDSKDSQDIGKGKAARDEHEAVRAMRSLGELVLIGKNIQYLNRIHITSTPAVGVPSATSVTPDTVTRGKQQELIIAGSLLQDAKVIGPTGFTITKVKPDDKGTSISLTLETDSSVPLGVNLLTISTPGGSTIAKVTVAAPASPDNCQDVKAGEPCLNTAEPHE